MINIIDYFFGLIHCYINDQLNIVYIVKFTNSDKLDELKAEMDETISGLNKFYRNLYAPALPFKDLGFKSSLEEVCLSKESKYYNLDLKNYKFVKLNYIKDENETEFIITCSHIIMDGVSIVAFAYYLFQGYSLERIASYINFPKAKKELSDFLKARPIKKNRFSQIAKYLRRGKKGESQKSYVNFRKKDKDLTSSPCVIENLVKTSFVRKTARKYKISRENYLTLKLVESIFQSFPNEKDGNTCLLNLTKNIRLNPINFTDEPLGNYSGRRYLEFKRNKLSSFEEYINCYIDELNDKSYFDDLIQEWSQTQKLNWLPKSILDRFTIRTLTKPSEGLPSYNISASFSYVPLRLAMAYPPEFLEKYKTNLLSFKSYLRVIRHHGPCFVVLPNTEDDYAISLTFNEAFMGKTEAENLLGLYKELILEG